MKLSIITINYNNKADLEKTVHSVAGQTFQDFEYIIIDGGSTDGSVDIIKQHAASISYWVSEPDTGIYNAMNKGIRAARGEYLLFLNSGDWFCNNDILSIFAKDTNGYDIIYGDQYYYYSDGRTEEDRTPGLLTFYSLGFNGSLPHQASLIKRTFLAEHGGYDENLKMVADWKFAVMAVFKWQCTYLHKPVFVVNYNKEGLSSDNRHHELQQNERAQVLKTEFPNFMYLKNEWDEANKVLLYYKYSRIVGWLIKIGILKKFSYFS
ncbi:MAG: glycosyltransferase [Ferruginibacter sp.]|nr:glycosyltransferase [Ferruginibacter sp.]